jgi:hypothetical protein
MIATTKTSLKATRTGIERQVPSSNGSSVYYSASEFRKLAQKDLQCLLKKYGRV